MSHKPHTATSLCCAHPKQTRTSHSARFATLLIPAPCWTQGTEGSLSCHQPFPSALVRVSRDFHPTLITGRLKPSSPSMHIARTTNCCSTPQSWGCSRLFRGCWAAPEHSASREPSCLVPDLLAVGNDTHLWSERKDILPDVVELGGPKDTHVPIGPSCQAHLLVAA